MATIYDVAKLAGASPATVSRVLNGIPVTAAKAEAVRRAIAELRFTPNKTARGLRTQTSEVIGLIIPDVANPYFTQVARGVEDAAQAAGYSVVLCNSDADLEKESVYLRIAVSQNMAGVVIAATGSDTEISQVTRSGRPVVAVDRVHEMDADAVVIANRDAAYAATSNLLDAGFTRIACVAGPTAIDTARNRIRGWREAMEERLGTSPADDLLIETNFQVDGGLAAMRELLDRSTPPDAVLLSNNLQGVGAMQALAERGIAPSSMGLAMIGDFPFAMFPRDDIAVVHLPARQMGAQAAQLLIDRLRGDDEPARTVVLSGELESPYGVPAVAGAGSSAE